MSHWVHVMSSFRGQWIPGDARGFRSRKHRIHSSGDYRSPPPIWEHAGLRAYARSVANPPIFLERELRRPLVEALLEKWTSLDVPVAAICVDAVHCHALLRTDKPRDAFGRAKQFASLRLRARHPGRLWGASSGCRSVRSLDHFIRTLNYIAGHETRGAFVWIHERFAHLRTPASHDA